MTVRGDGTAAEGSGPAGSISFALVLHNHQPVGNFGWVIEELWRTAYEPTLAGLERHPTVRVGLHYTGPLLEWIAANEPDGLARIVALVERGQVELLGGGWTEPILVSLPVADRHGQLVRMADEVERLCGVRPRGAWLAERVWEPGLASDLAGAGYEYTIVDDNHLRSAAVPDEAMWGTYNVDDQGRRLTVFGSEQGLRYGIPWRPVPEVIEHLRSHATPDGRRVGMMGDDGEKLGGWPGTHELCWGSGAWMDTFFRALEDNRSWLKTVRPSDWIDRVPPVGRVAIPTTSYLEMTEWALPPHETQRFRDAVKRARETGDPPLMFLRGGTWRAFQARYREVNDLHKQMLRVSAKVAAMAEGPDRDRATEHLYRGQSNDVYWHGLFGGIYLADLRMAVLRELIAAEDIAEGGSVTAAVSDLDLDGQDEVLLASDGQVVVVDPADGGGITSWDLLASRVALASVLRRRPEAYHEESLAIAAGSAGTGSATEPSSVDAPTPASTSAAPGGSTPEANAAHDPGGPATDRLHGALVYDRHERRSALVHVLDPVAAEDIGAAELAVEAFEDLGELVASPFEIVELGPTALALVGRSSVRGRPVTLTKRFALGGTRLEPTLEVTLEVGAEDDGPSTQVELDLEWGVQLLGGGGNPHAWYEAPAGSDPGGLRDAGGAGPVEGLPGDATAPMRVPHDGTGDLREASTLAFGNDLLGVRIDMTAEPAARLTWHSVDTVSNSEAGFERIYQGSALHVRWPVTIGREPTTLRVLFVVSQARDLAES